MIVDESNDNYQESYTNSYSLPLESFVINSNGKYLYTSPPKKTIQNIGDDSEYIDHDRELKDICTTFVTHELFKSEQSLIKFFKLVSSVYDASLSIYKTQNNFPPDSVYFTFKGGNILKIVEREFLRDMPGIAMEILDTHYSKDFQPSDADFSIYIRPDLPQFDKVVSEVTSIALCCQLHTQSVLNSAPDEYFDFFKLNYSNQIKTLSNYFSLFSHAKCFSDPNNTKYNGSTFVQVLLSDVSYPELNIKPFPYSGITNKYIYLKDETNLKSISVVNISNPKMIYVSDNRSLHFFNDNLETHFNLVRTKLALNIVIAKAGNFYNIPIGGELIDVGISRDEQNAAFFSDLTNNTAQYNLHSPTDTLTFQSYSYSFLIHDLELILIYGNKLSWTQGKYKKRLNRLFLLYFIDISVFHPSQNITNTQKNIYLQLILSDILIPLAEQTSVSDTKLDKLINLYPQLHFTTFLLKLKTLKHLINLPEFITFVEACIENIHVLIKTIEAIEYYEFSLLTNVKEQRLYTGPYKKGVQSAGLAPKKTIVRHVKDEPVVDKKQVTVVKKDQVKTIIKNKKIDDVKEEDKEDRKKEEKKSIVTAKRTKEIKMNKLKEISEENEMIPVENVEVNEFGLSDENLKAFMEMDFKSTLILKILKFFKF